MSDYPTYLCHYGVVGMKWGVRKQRVSSGVRTSRRWKGEHIPTRGGLSRGQREKANRRLVISAAKTVVQRKMTRKKGADYVNRYLNNHSRTKVSSIVLTTAAAVGAAAAAKYVVPKVGALAAEKMGRNPYSAYRQLQTVGNVVDRFVGKGAIGAGATALALKGAGVLNNKRLAKKNQTSS